MNFIRHQHYSRLCQLIGQLQIYNLKSIKRKTCVFRWRELHIAAGYSTSQEYSDEDVMMAAGVLEGFLSQL